jgi:hypothetical protein
MTELAQYCHEADYTASSGTCAAPYYGPATGLFPALSVADAQSIGQAIAVLWALAWCIRRIKRFIDQS